MIDIQHNTRNFDDDDDDKNSSALRLSCFAHTLQLSIRDGLKKASHVPKVLAKCQALAKFSHKSTKIADMLDQLNKHVNKSNVTRWNSEYLLIKSILSLGKIDADTITSLMDNPVKFSNNDFIILEEIVTILDPFYEISIKCQAEAVVTASLVVPSVVHLITHLRDIKRDVKFCGRLAQQLQSSLEKRFCGIMDRLNQADVIDDQHYGDPLYFIAAVLDPAFKFFWLRDLQLSVQMENRLKQHIIQLIVDEMNKEPNLSPGHLDRISPARTSASSASTPKAKRRKLFDYDDVNSSDLNEPNALDPVVELDAYLNDPVRLLFSDYWHRSQLSILKRLITRIFSVQASSAPIERVFSHAGLILTPKRTNMNEQMLRDLVFLRVNQSLL